MGTSVLLVIAAAHLLPMIVSGNPNESGESSYDLQLAYFHTPGFNYTDRVEETLKATATIFATLTPSVRLVHAKGTHLLYKVADMYVESVGIREELNRHIDILFVALGEDDPEPPSEEGQLCSYSYIDRTVYLNVSTTDNKLRLAQDLAEKIARKMMIPPNCKNSGFFELILLEDVIVKFTSCVSDGLRKYINNFWPGYFCLAKEYYGLNLALYTEDFDYQLVDNTAISVRDVVDPWFSRLREVFYTLNPTINLYRTVMNGNMDKRSIQTRKDLLELLYGDRGIYQNISIIVLSSHSMDIKSRLDRFIYKGGFVCDQDPLRKTIVVVLGSTWQENQKAFERMATDIAVKLGILPGMNRPAGREVCRGLVEETGNWFSPCSSRWLQRFISGYKAHNGGQFCLPRIG